MSCRECHDEPRTYGTIHGERCAYNSGFPTCGAHLCSICDHERISLDATAAWRDAQRRYEARNLSG